MITHTLLGNRITVLGVGLVGYADTQPTEGRHFQGVVAAFSPVLLGRNDQIQMVGRGCDHNTQAYVSLAPKTPKIIFISSFTIHVRYTNKIMHWCQIAIHNETKQ